MFRSTFAVFASILLLTVTLGAQPRGGIMAAADDLELTDQQIEKLQDLRYRHQKDMIAKQAELKEARLELKELMRQAGVDEKAAMARQERVLRARDEIARAGLKHKLAARNVLTEEQFGKWQKMQQGKKHHRGQGRGGGFDCPRPEFRHGMGPGEGKGPGPGMGRP